MTKQQRNTDTMTEAQWQRIPKLPQSQAALDRQIREMIAVADKVGLYDAADWARAIFERRR